MEILRDFGHWSIVVDSCAIAVASIRTTGLVAIYTHFHGCSRGHCSKDGPSRRIVSSRKAEADPHCNLSLNWNDELHWMNSLKLWNAGNGNDCLEELGPLGVESGAATNPVTRPFSVLIWGSRDLETLCFGAALVAFVQFSDRGKTERCKRSYCTRLPEWFCLPFEQENPIVGILQRFLDLKFKATKK